MADASTVDFATMKDRSPVTTVLFAISLAGLVASCAFHAASFFGFSPDLSNSRVWEVHLVATFLIIAALLAGWSVARTLRPQRFIKRAFRYAPSSYRTVARALVIYACVAGIVILISSGHGGVQYLFERGGVTDSRRVLELRSKSNDVSFVRLLTCFWIAGYAIAAALLASARNAPADNR
jgi:uncharacterized membrane protein YidH (DUF202 family)